MLHAWNNQTLCIRPWCYQNHQPLFKFPACCSAEHSKVLTPSSAILNPEPQLNSDRGRSKALSLGFIHGRCAYFSDDPLLWGARCVSWCWGGLTMSWAACHSCPSPKYIIDPNFHKIHSAQSKSRWARIKLDFCRVLLTLTMGWVHVLNNTTDLFWSSKYIYSSIAYSHKSLSSQSHEYSINRRNFLFTIFNRSEKCWWASVKAQHRQP